MAFCSRVFICILLAVLLFSFETNAQEIEFPPAYTQHNDSLRIGLVLSGGGALGIAHIGVIQALEEAGIRIDYITGTSMGSLVGGLYAIGYSSNQLAEIARSNNFSELFTEKPDRRYISNYEKITDDRTIATFPINEKSIDLPGGILTGQNVYTYISRLTRHVHGIEDFDNFPIPFAAVATNLETGEAKVFRSGYLPDALRASISIPSVFSPHRIDDNLYVDGGLIRNLPVQDAIEMGANYTIAVDVSSPLMKRDSLNTLSSVLNQSIYFRIHDYTDIQREMADYVIRIEELEPYSASDFDSAENLLEIGQKAGKRHLDEFKKIAARQNAKPVIKKGVEPQGSLPVENVIVHGNSLYDDQFIINQLDFIPGTMLDPQTIEEKVIRLYSSQYIENVTYRLLPIKNSQYYTLQIHIDENNTDEFNVGLRYDSGEQASILLEGNFQNLIQNGSLTRFEARLGDRINFQTDHAYYGALGSNLAILTTLQYFSESVDWYADNRRISQFKNEVIRTELSGGNYLSIQNLFAIGIRRDFNYHSNRINPQGIAASREDYHSVFLRYIHDNLNRNSYPTSGKKLVLEGHYSDEVIFSELNFTSADLFYKGYYQINEDLSITNSLWMGHTTGDKLPWGYWKSPNRYNDIYDFIRFSGAEPYEISTRNAKMVSLGIQAEPFYHRFIGIDIYAGQFEKNWQFNFLSDDTEYGISVSLGALTILGPAKVIFSGSTLNNLHAELQIGYQF